MFKSLFNFFFTSNKVKEEQKKDIKSNAVNNFVYLFNDPTTPSLKGDMVMLPNPSPGYQVMNIAQQGEAGQRAKQVYTACNITQNYVQKILEKGFTKWAATQSLKIHPEAGKQFNAYYDRSNLKFFYDKDPVTKKIVYAADSVDVVAHELGHAILDAIRPDFWNMQALEIWSFHEACGDITAILGLMQQDDVIHYALKETDGNIRKHNVISRLAEELGTAIYHVVDGRNGYKSGALRDANNNFVYVSPEKLPSNAPANQLAAECHSFGRIFLGAWYDIMIGMYERNLKSDDNYKALIKARNSAAYLFYNALRHASATPRFYDSMARAMLFVDRINGSKYEDLLNNVFKERKILKHRVKALSDMNFNDLKLGEMDRIMSDSENKAKIVVKSEFKTLKLADHFGLRAQSDNPLYNVELEVPSETYFEFNEYGNLVDEIHASEKMLINSARACINILHQEKMVGKNNHFDIVDGKLVRNHIECPCCR